MELSGYRLLLTILACYRLSRLIAIDDGPFLVFKRMRYYFKDNAFYEILDNGIDPNNEGQVERWYGKYHTIAEGITCPYCVGVWLSVPLVVLYLWPTVYGDMFLVLMSISAGQAFLQSLERK